MPTVDLNTFTFRRCTIDDIIDLRYAMLCAHRPFEEAQFDGDDDADTRHFGVFLSTDSDDATPTNIGCATYMFTEWDHRPAWQLRGMAIATERAKQGIGTRLIQFAHEALREADVTSQLWCNARAPAIPFYERLGWTVASEEFVVPNYGPHRKMTAEL